MTWSPSPDRWNWATEAPDGTLLTVTKTIGGWVPAVQAWRGEPCATRTEAQRAAEVMAAAA